jgi:hypothetical protein
LAHSWGSADPALGSAGFRLDKHRRLLVQCSHVPAAALVLSDRFFFVTVKLLPKRRPLDGLQFAGSLVTARLKNNEKLRTLLEEVSNDGILVQVRQANGTEMRKINIRFTIPICLDDRIPPSGEDSPAGAAGPLGCLEEQRPGSGFDRRVFSCGVN